MPEAVLPTSLPGEINAATRSSHTTLNRLITSRLPLALPPHTTDPTLYTTGLVHFSHIFFTFESIWTDLIATPSDPPTSPLLSFLLVNPYDSPELFSSTPSPELLDFLQGLRPPGLARSPRLKRDLQVLTGLHPTDLSVLLAQYPGDKVAEFCAHIRTVVKQRPHVLLAYAWCFYMAVFSGGRWIRAQLINAGEEFWQMDAQDEDATEEDAGPEGRGLSLWHFDGEQDGEDIKAEFKRRLAVAETLFSADERVDIIEEAKNIFRLCATLVDELDEQIGTDMDKLAQAERSAKAKIADINLIPPTTTKSAQSRTMWLQRPEVTGAVVALGCLACAVMLKLAPDSGW